MQTLLVQTLDRSTKSARLPRVDKLFVSILTLLSQRNLLVSVSGVCDSTLLVSLSLSLSLSLSPLEARLLELRTVRWFSDCSSLNIVRRFISVATEAATDGGQTCSDSRTSVGSRRADNKTKQRRRSASAWLAGAWLVEVRRRAHNTLCLQFRVAERIFKQIGLERGSRKQVTHTTSHIVTSRKQSATRQSGAVGVMASVGRRLLRSTTAAAGLRNGAIVGPSLCGSSPAAIG